MESYDLAELVVKQDAQDWHLVFSRARLTVVSDHGTRLWYVDIDGVADEALLRKFSETERIDIAASMTTIGGRRLKGNGFLHPNPRHRAAAIRGDGPLDGFESL